MHSILARRLESEILLCIGSKTKFKVDSLFITCRFCYEVAALSWWEKKMAATLFAEVPTTSMVHAFQIDIDMYWMESVRRHISHCVCSGRGTRAFRERLKPDGWKENRQFLAKSLVQLGEVEEAVVWLERAAAMPVKNPDVRTQRIF